MARSTIQTLQVFRGLAALAVVGHHAVVSTGAFVGAVPTGVLAVLGAGYLGVDFFFVLSGFIIMYAHMDDERTPAAVRRYAFKRLVRIFPAYLPVSLALMTLYATLPGLSASGGREYSLASSLFLLPADDPPALSVAWTLVHEMLFYTVFLLFFVSRRLLITGLFLWGGVIVASNLLHTPSGWVRYPLSLLNIEFMFGVLSAHMVRNLPGRYAPSGFIVAGTALGTAMLVMLQPENSSFVRMAFAAGLALLVVGFALLERKSGLAWPAWLLLIGNASYSIYLVHNPLLSLTQRVAGRLGLGWDTALAAGVGFSVLMGLAYFHVIERPALAYFRNRIGRARPCAESPKRWAG